MITVVISTRKRDEDYLKKVTTSAGVKNIQILCYENNGEFSLTHLYNKGLEESSYDTVVFMHDDLLFEPGSKWGVKLMKHFENTDYGILGKAGTTRMGKDVVWWNDMRYIAGRVYHEQMDPQTGKKKTWLSAYSGNFDKNIVPVVAVDGLFFAVHKPRLAHTFNEELVPGFHFYDIDFCLANHFEGVKIGVVFDFAITHKSIGATNVQWEQNRISVANHWREKLPTEVGVDIIYKDKPFNVKKQPKVSIVIPTKGNVDYISKLLQSIAQKSSYLNLEIIVADTGSTPEEKVAVKSMLKAMDAGYPAAKMVEYDYYNFAKINNDVVRNHISADTELIILCNNDVELVNDCISRMVDTYQRNRAICGTVGARLHYSNNTVQHNGIFLIQPKGQGVVRFGHLAHHTAYRYEDKVTQVPGNTAALLLISKKLFEKIGGLNECYNICFEDVELNLQTLLRGCKNFVCSEAVAYHHESLTRGKSTDENDVKRIYDFIHENYQRLLPNINLK